jgi:hypothetical protein
MQAAVALMGQKPVRLRLEWKTFSTPDLWAASFVLQIKPKLLKIIKPNPELCLHLSMHPS